jgi:hypothetical protein
MLPFSLNFLFEFLFTVFSLLILPEIITYSLFSYHYALCSELYCHLFNRDTYRYCNTVKILSYSQIEQLFIEASHVSGGHNASYISQLER